MDKQKRTVFLQQILAPTEFQQLQEDTVAMECSLELYDEAYIDSVDIVSIHNKQFLIPKTDLPKLPKKWILTLQELARKEPLLNPVYVHVEPDGVLLVD